MSLFAAVVSYTLPGVDREPGRVKPAVLWALGALGAGLVVASFAVFGLTIRGAVAAFFCLVLVLVTATDLEYHLIPNRVVVPGAAIVLTGMAAARPSLEWILAALAAASFLFVFSVVSPRGMGMGDVKLAFMMGGALGRSVAVALMIATVASLIPSIAILVKHGRAGRKMGFPFGPFLALGSIVTLFLHAAH